MLSTDSVGPAGSENDKSPPKGRAPNPTAVALGGYVLIVAPNDRNSRSFEKPPVEVIPSPTRSQANDCRAAACRANLTTLPSSGSSTTKSHTSSGTTQAQTGLAATPPLPE